MMSVMSRSLRNWMAFAALLVAGFLAMGRCPMCGRMM